MTGARLEGLVCKTSMPRDRFLPRTGAGLACDEFLPRSRMSLQPWSAPATRRQLLDPIRRALHVAVHVRQTCRDPADGSPQAPQAVHRPIAALGRRVVGGGQSSMEGAPLTPPPEHIEHTEHRTGGNVPRGGTAAGGGPCCPRSSGRLPGSPSRSPCARGGRRVPRACWR